MLARLKEKVKNFWEKTKAYFDVETDDIPDYYDFEPEPEVVKVNSAVYKSQTVKVKSENKIKEFFECLAIKADDVDLPEDYIEEERLKRKRLKENEIILELTGIADFGHGYYIENNISKGFYTKNNF